MNEAQQVFPAHSFLTRVPPAPPAAPLATAGSGLYAISYSVFNVADLA